MQDISPGIAIGSFIGGLAAALKVLAEVLKWKNERRLKNLEKEIPPSIRPPPPAHAPPTLSLELKLQAKEIELMRAQYQIDQMTQKLSESSARERQLSARVTEQELLNRQLADEMAELRRQGGGDDVDRTRTYRDRGGAHGVDPIPRPVRASRGARTREDR